jgi:hypothetical protein
MIHDAVTLNIKIIGLYIYIYIHTPQTYNTKTENGNITVMDPLKGQYAHSRSIIIR